MGYLNGVIVGRINMVEEIDGVREWMSVNEARVISKNHIHLGMVGIRGGKNGLVVEDHCTVCTW